MAHFQLQPKRATLDELAAGYWKNTGEREHHLERAAYEAGTSIRNGDHSVMNLEVIVRWKSDRMVYYLLRNSEAKIRQTLALIANPETSVRQSVDALNQLQGIDLAIASAVLAVVHPEKYAVLDFRTLEALGHTRHNIEFYEQYLAYMNGLAMSGMMKGQNELPGPTPLHAIERAFWEWSRQQQEARKAH